LYDVSAGITINYRISHPIRFLFKRIVRPIYGKSVRLGLKERIFCLLLNNHISVSGKKGLRRPLLFFMCMRIPVPAAAITASEHTTTILYITNQYRIHDLFLFFLGLFI
jgi:hypothetical protein